MILPDPFRLDGRTALICGAGRGLAWEIARMLAGAGAHVVLNGRSEERLVPRVRELLDQGLSAEALAFDIRDRATMQDRLASLATSGRSIDVLVNAVGERDRRPADDITVDEFAHLIEADLTSAYALARAVLPAMLQRGWGRIVMLGSIVDQHAVPNAASYIAAKGGLSAMVRALAAEYGRRGVTCNTLSPGFFATETNHTMANSDTGRTMARRVPIGRWGRPEEIAGAALFLCSPSASYVNGHTLVVDGGVTATYGMPQGFLI